MTTYRGVVNGNVIVLPPGVHLDDGVAVEVHVVAPRDERGGEAGRDVNEQERAEEEFKQRLREAGLLGERPSHPPHLMEGDRTPITVRGEPLSEMIIRERR